MVRLISILIVITFLGGLLRFINLTPFTVYPDSFQNIVVAENIIHYRSVVGYLGENGLFYPDFFMWTRPLYPLLILVVSSFHLSFLTSARIIAYILGVLAIPLSYLFIKSVFKNTMMGIVAALLLALSYNHTIWSGIPMTEAVGVFFLLLFLWRFFATVTGEVSNSNLQVGITGLLFCLSVIERYEYAILVIPIIFLTLRKSPKPFYYFSILFLSAAVGFALFGFILFPMGEVFQVIFNQFSHLIIKVTILLTILIILIFIYRFLPILYKKRIRVLFPSLLRILLTIFFFYIIVQVLYGNPIALFGVHLNFIISFAQHDILLSVFGFIGLVTLLNDKKNVSIAYFILLSLLFLVIIYYQINPDMERYITHVVPFLLISAGYGVISFFRKAQSQKKYRVVMYIIFLFLLLLQIIITGRGLRYLNESSWYHDSYEQKAALLVNQYIKGKPLLITSSPESYYYFTGLDTQSITDSSPYLYLPAISKQQHVLIIEDMGMRLLFPHFTSIVDKRLQKYKYTSFKVNEHFQREGSSIPENSPIVLYKIKVGTLMDLLK